MEHLWQLAVQASADLAWLPVLLLPLGALTQGSAPAELERSAANAERASDLLHDLTPC